MKLFGFLKCKAMFKWVWGKFCHTITPARFMKEHLTITSYLAIKLVSVSWATVVTTGNLSFYSKQLGINCNCEKGLTACNSIFGCFSHSCELEKVGSVHMQLIHYGLEKKTDCRAVMNISLYPGKCGVWFRLIFWNGVFVFCRLFISSFLFVWNNKPV